VSAVEKKRPGAFMFLITEHRGRKKLHVISRSYRSKWWMLTCFCGRARKDGTCVFTDQAVSQVIPSVRPRVRLEHPRRGGETPE
jgi:hypothetical protein